MSWPTASTLHPSEWYHQRTIYLVPKLETDIPDSFLSPSPMCTIPLNPTQGMEFLTLEMVSFFPCPLCYLFTNHWNSLLTGFSVYAFTTSNLSFRLKSENANLIKFSAQNSSPAPHCQAVKPIQLSESIPNRLLKSGGTSPWPTPSLFSASFSPWHLSSSEILCILLASLLPIFLFQVETTQG